MTTKGGNLLNRNDIVQEVVGLNPELDPTDVDKAIEILFGEIATSLVCGDRVELRGFGSWIVRKRPGKIVRNPKTNTKLKVGDKGFLYFRASKDLIKKLNNL